MKVNLNILEVEKEHFAALGLEKQWDLRLGSSPRHAGEEVEGMRVPEGKVWLFPLGGDFAAIEKHIQGRRIAKVCYVDDVDYTSDSLPPT